MDLLVSCGDLPPSSSARSKTGQLIFAIFLHSHPDLRGSKAIRKARRQALSWFWKSCGLSSAFHVEPQEVQATNGSSRRTQMWGFPTHTCLSTLSPEGLPSTCVLSCSAVLNDCPPSFTLRSEHWTCNSHTPTCALGVHSKLRLI